MGYFYPERWPAQLESLGEKSEGGRRFLVVRATPKGGRPYDIWIDAGTHLIDHTVEKAAIETRTVYSSTIVRSGASVCPSLNARRTAR